MTRLQRTMGVLAACALVGTSAAQAEGFKPGSDCNPSGFTTCMAVHLSVLKDGLSVGEKNRSWQDWAGEGRNKTYKFVPGDHGVGLDHPGNDGVAPGACPVPSHNPRDCASVVTVTPEPVTMTLLATGLLSMSGMGFVSRRRKQKFEQM